MSSFLTNCIKITGSWVGESKNAITSSDEFYYNAGSEQIFYAWYANNHLKYNFLRYFLKTKSEGLLRDGMRLYFSQTTDYLLFGNASDLYLEIIKIKFEYLGLSFEKIHIDNYVNGLAYGKIIFADNGHLPAFVFSHDKFVEDFTKYDKDLSVLSRVFKT